MDLDNDLLTPWLNALVLDETEIRSLIEQIQEARNDADTNKLCGPCASCPRGVRCKPKPESDDS